MTSIISFPGLGIGEFSVNSVAFSIFGHSVTWYGIIVTSAIVVGFLYALYRSKFEGITNDDVLDEAIYLIIFSIIGARLYYVVTSLDKIKYDSFYDVIAIWNGGLAIYGGVIAGAITTFVVAKIKKIKFTKMFDMISPGLMLGQAIGRWGNFMNAEAFGGETTLPWRMGIQNIYHIDTIYVHPTFLYESLWNLIGFFIINALYKKKRFDGQIFLMYATWYGFGRMFIEGLRTDSLYVGQFRISQLVAAASFIAGLILLIVFSRRASVKTAAGAAANLSESAQLDADILNADTVNDTKADGNNSIDAVKASPEAEKDKDNDKENK
ncbi:MAG: prolipoprotein diacylglyceryl transferase [Eubacteriales bacterium]